MKILILETSRDWYTPNLLTLNRMKILILENPVDWHTPNLLTQDLNEDSHFGFPSRVASSVISGSGTDCLTLVREMSQ